MRIWEFVHSAVAEPNKPRHSIYETGADATDTSNWSDKDHVRKSGTRGPDVWSRHFAFNGEPRPKGYAHGSGVQLNGF